MSRIINQKTGIWEKDFLLPSIEPQFRLSMGEGETPIYEVKLGDDHVFLKDETKNPNQAFKDRGIAFQLSYYYEKGYRDFVISSSGNAARSVIAYASLIPDSRVRVYVSDDIPDYKFKKIEEVVLRDQEVDIVRSKTAKSDAIKFSRETGAINLRGSVDEQAVPGFKTLGWEIADSGLNADAIFICCSSGTSTVGIYEGLVEYFSLKKIDLNGIPQIHIVQTTKINPIAKEFDKEFISSQESVVNAVSDRVAHRKNTVWDIIKATKGFGWVVSDEEVLEAKKLLIQKGIQVEGYNAYTSFAGYLKSVEHGNSFQNSVCILTGL